MSTINNHTGVPHFWFEKSGPEGEAPYKSRKNGDKFKICKPIKRRTMPKILTHANATKTMGAAIDSYQTQGGEHEWL